MHNCHVKFKFSMCLFNIPCKLLSCACGPYIRSLIPVTDALRLHFTLFYRQFGNLGNTRQRSKKKLTDPCPTIIHNKIRISHKLCEFLVRNSKTDVLEDCLQIKVKPAKSGSTEAVWWYLYMKREISQKNSDKSPSNQRQCHKEMGSCLSTGFDQRIVRTGPWISKALADLNVADLTFKVIISCTSGSVSTAAIFRFFVGSPVISPCTCASAMCTWSQVCQNSESSTWSSFLKRWMKLVMKSSEW